MLTIRKLEAVSAQLYTTRLIRGFCHLYSGQESVCVGMVAAFGKNDSIITAYRCHGWAFMMGLTPVQIIAELVGRQKGMSRGKGGSMHIYGKRFYGGNGIVGAQVPLGAGVALANKYKGDGGVCVALYGDGASNQGQIFEAYNMAYIMNLPVIFVCENNLYGMGTAVNRHAQNTNFYERGDNVPGLWVDGNDLMTVKNATEFAIDYAKTTGPVVLEMETYRYFGHSMSDPGTSYRSREEVEQVRKTRDPIKLFTELMLSEEVITEDELKGIEKRTKELIDKAKKDSVADKEIGLDELTADIELKYLDKGIRGAIGNLLPHKRIGKQFVEDKMMVPKTPVNPKPAREMLKAPVDIKKPKKKDD